MKKTATSPDATTSHASPFKSKRKAVFKSETSTAESDYKGDGFATDSPGVFTNTPIMFTSGQNTPAVNEETEETPDNITNETLDEPASEINAAPPVVAPVAEEEETTEDELDEEIVGTVTSTGSFDGGAEDPEDEDLTKIDSPQAFANKYFTSVSGYSWDKLKIYLGSNGTGEQNQKLRLLLKTLITHNQELSPEQLWSRIELDPSSLNGYQSFLAYYGAELNTASTAAVSVENVSDLDAGVQGLKEQTITYRTRKFIFETQKNRDKAAAASQEATNFLHATASNIEQTMNGVNEHKKLLESQLGEMTSSFNQTLASDAQSKNALVNQLTARLRASAQNAKDGVISDYQATVAKIDQNTAEQKQKLRNERSRVVAQLQTLQEGQQGKLSAMVTEFGKEINETAKIQQDAVVEEGKERAGTMANSNLGRAKKQAVTKTATNTYNEIGQLAKTNIRNALEKEDQASTPYQQSLENLGREMTLQEKMLTDQGASYKESAREAMEAHNFKIDELAIASISSMTGMLEIYFSKVTNFAELEENILEAFYTGSVTKLDEASREMIRESRERLAVFASGQQGLKKPGKRKLRKREERVTNDISPWLAQAEQDSTEASLASQAELAMIKQKIYAEFQQLSDAGTADFYTFIQGAETDLVNVRQQATPVMTEVSEKQATGSALLVTMGRERLKSEVETLKQAYQDQLISVEIKLQEKLDLFKAETTDIVLSLTERMDRAEQKVRVSEVDDEKDHGFLYNGVQYIMDNSVNLLILDFLEAWRQVPKTERGKKIKAYMSWARAVLIKVRDTEPTWLEEIFYALFPSVKWINMFTREFFIGFLDQLISLPDTQLVEAIENIFYNMTRLDFFIGYGKGIFVGMWDWVMDIVNTVKDVGKFIIGLFDVNAHMEKMKKLGPKIEKAMLYITSAEGQQQILEMVQNFKLDDLSAMAEGMITGFAQDMGKSVADQLVKFMLLGPEDMGYSIGRLVGYLIVEILVDVFSAGIAAAAKAGLKAFQGIMKILKIFFSKVGKITRKVAGEAVGLFRDVLKFIKEISTMLKNRRKNNAFFEKLHEFMEGMQDFMKGKFDDATKANKKTVDIDDDVPNFNKKLDEVGHMKNDKVKKMENAVDEPKKKKFQEESLDDPEFDKKKKDYPSKAAALATAKAITEGADLLDTPIPALMTELAFLKRMDGVKDFSAKRIGPNTYKIIMHGCNPVVDEHYDTAGENDPDKNKNKTESVEEDLNTKDKTQDPEIERQRLISEKARKLDDDGGHSYMDHGAQTTEAQHVERLQTGKAPGGEVRTIPDKSSKFMSDEMHVQAYEDALIKLETEKINSKGGLKKVVVLKNKPLPNSGISYILDASGNPVSSLVNEYRAIFRLNETTRTYKLVTLFPE